MKSIVDMKEFCKEVNCSETQFNVICDKVKDISTYLENNFSDNKKAKQKFSKLLIKYFYKYMDDYTVKETNDCVFSVNHWKEMKLLSLCNPNTLDNNQIINVIVSEVMFESLGVHIVSIDVNDFSNNEYLWKSTIEKLFGEGDASIIAIKFEVHEKSTISRDNFNTILKKDSETEIEDKDIDNYRDCHYLIGEFKKLIRNFISNNFDIEGDLVKDSITFRCRTITDTIWTDDDFTQTYQHYNGIVQELRKDVLKEAYFKEV